MRRAVRLFLSGALFGVIAFGPALLVLLIKTA